MIPGLVGLFQPELVRWIFSVLLFITLGVLPVYLLGMLCYAWITSTPFRQILPGWIRTRPTAYLLGTDLKYDTLPCMTILLILINILIHISFPGAAGYFSFPIHWPASWFQDFLAFFLHGFIHANDAHLTGNMFFLFIFGSSIEARTGPLKFLGIYLACLAASTVFVWILLYIRLLWAGTPFFSSIGSSGAIAGIMGVFAVRCYFANFTGFSVWVFANILTPVRVRALVFICLFFAVDTAGSRAQFGENASNINHWAHVGGYLFGFALAFGLGFHKKASEEAVGVKADRLRTKPFEKKKAAGMYQDILARDPENIEALTFFLDHYRHNHHKQPYIFGMLLKALVPRNMEEAAALFSEYYPRHLEAIPGKTALLLGIHFRQKTALQKARACLEVARGKPGLWQAKATFLLGKVFEDMGNDNLAAKTYQEVRIKFPGTSFAREAAKN